MGKLQRLRPTSRSAGVPAGLLAVLLLSACAPKLAIPPAPADLREQPGNVEIVVMPYDWEADSEKPLSGAGAGAAYGLANGAMIGAMPIGLCSGGEPLSCAVGLLTSVVTIPVGGVVGAAAGASMARSEAEVEGAALNLDNALKTSSFDAQLADALKQEARRAGVERVQLYDAGDPAASAAPGAAVQASEDLRLLVRIERMEMQMLGKLDPDITFTESVTATAFRPAQGTPFYTRRWIHKTKPVNFFDSVQDDALLLRSTLAAAQLVLAKALVEQSFLRDDLLPLDQARSFHGVETIPVSQTLVEIGRSRGPSGAPARPESGTAAAPPKQPDREQQEQSAIAAEFATEAQAGQYYALLRAEAERSYRQRLEEIADDQECINAQSGPAYYRKCILGRERARRDRDIALVRIQDWERRGLRASD